MRCGCYQRRREGAHIGGGCGGCAALTHECAALHRRIELLERRLRADANLHALLAAKDRQLTLCRARLERLEGPTTATRCDPDVEKRGERAKPAKEHLPSKHHHHHYHHHHHHHHFRLSIK